MQLSRRTMLSSLSCIAGALIVPMGNASGQVSRMTASAFSFDGLDGQPIRLADHAGKPILAGKCGMLQQAGFYGAQWTSFKPDVKVAEDGDVFAFYLPQMDASVAANPVVGGGEFTVAFSDRPEVQAVQTYMSSPEYATARAIQGSNNGGGWVSANSGVDPSVYTNPIDALSVKYLTDANATFRFDASDLMPAAVGAGAEWTQMTAWFAEDKPTADVTAAIDAAWPSS